MCISYTFSIFVIIHQGGSGNVVIREIRGWGVVITTCVCINEVKVTHQGEGHIEVKVKIATFFPILCKILLISTYYFSMCGYNL